MTELDRCWKNCLAMWKWISENLPIYFIKLNYSQRRYVVCDLKKKWLKSHHFKDKKNWCFFCEYSMAYSTAIKNCECCPGRLIQLRLKTYWCEHGRNENNNKYRLAWHWNPKAFYQRLLKLNAKREGQK